jgi:tetratricopeptide (TPR) repeat protein
VNNGKWFCCLFAFATAVAAVPAQQEAPQPEPAPLTENSKYLQQLEERFFEANKLTREQKTDAALEAYRAIAKDYDDHWLAHFYIALILSQRGDLEGARAALEKALASYPEAAEARMLLGRVLRQLGDSEAALRELRKASERLPKNADLFFQIGQLLLNQTPPDPEQAIKALDHAAILAPNQPRYQMALGRAYELSGDSDKALEAYKKATEFGETIEETWIRLGSLELNMGLNQPAEEHLRRALELNQDSPRAHELLARLFLVTGRAEEAAEQTALTSRSNAAAAAPATPEQPAPQPAATATPPPPAVAEGITQMIESLERAIEADPSNARNIRLLALAYLREGRRADARAALTRAYDKGLNDEGLLLELAGVAQEDGDGNYALQVIDKILEQHPNSRRAYLLKGITLALMGRYPEGRIALETILSDEPEDAETRLQLGMILANSGDFDAATDQFRRVAAGEVMAGRGRLLLARLLYRRGQNETAETELKPLVESCAPELAAAVELMLEFQRAAAAAELIGASGGSPTCAPTLELQRGLIAIAQQDRGSARTHLEQAHRLAPDDTMITYNLANLSYLDQRYSEALALLEPLLAAQPDYLRGQFLLGMCAAANQQSDRAVRAFRKVIQLDANQPAAYLALLQVLDKQGKTEEVRELQEEIQRRFGQELQATDSAGASPGTQ